MKLEVLISAMDQEDMSLFEKTNIQTDAVMINQAGITDYSEKELNGHKLRMYTIADRGLSKSRNTAISQASGDICLLCDDDERLCDNYGEIIKAAYGKYTDADVIAFIVDIQGKTYKKKDRKLNRLGILKISSVQITFKRQSILNNNLRFNEQFGAGTEFCFGEENIFLTDCLKSGLKIYYFAQKIGAAAQVRSTWNSGYHREYFLNRGIITRYYLGKFLSALYAFYFIIFKFSLYKEDISPMSAVRNLLKGIYSKNIVRPK